MADLPPFPEADDDAGVGPDPGSTTSTPRWVPVVGVIIVIVVVSVLVVLHLTGTISAGPH